MQVAHKPASVIQSLVGLGPTKTHVEGRVLRRVVASPLGSASCSSGAGGGGAGRSFLSSLLRPGAEKGNEGNEERVELFRFEGDLAGKIALTDCATGEKWCLWVRPDGNQSAEAD